jgi:hypothetical protein
MDQSLNTGVIAEATYTESNPIRKLAKEILNGRTEPYSSEEIRRIVDSRYFSFEPLTNLTDEEASFLRSRMVNDFLNCFDKEKGTIGKFLQSECYQTPFQSEYPFGDIYARDALPDNFDCSRSRLRLMTANDKLAFLENPDYVEARWHTKNMSMDFSKMGYRTLKGYGNKFCGESFTAVVRQLQADSGKKELHVLDLGGGMGFALHDAKKMHPELVTYNATRDEEFAHYPTDFHVVGFMERMPLALQGKIDFIFSNMTTRYLAYSDLVIQCCVLMLAKGGFMDIFFSSERSNNRCEEDISRRMKKAHDYLKSLERSGEIQLTINHTYYGLGKHRSKNGTLYPAATVFVKKL